MPNSETLHGYTQAMNRNERIVYVKRLQYQVAYFITRFSIYVTRIVPRNSHTSSLSLCTTVLKMHVQNCLTHLFTTPYRPSLSAAKRICIQEHYRHYINAVFSFI